MAAHSFLTFPCFFLSGRYIIRHQTPLSFLFYSHSYIFFSPLLLFVSNVDIFKRATLSEMVNRCGTGSTHARLSRAKVMTSYVSSPDVLLTAIDFHLFTFTLRILSPNLSFFNPQNSNRAAARDIALLKFKIWSDCLSSWDFCACVSSAIQTTYVVTPAPLRRGKLPQP